MNGGALVFLGVAEASASPSFALPMFITIKKIIILHLILGVPAATVGGTGTPWHTRGYAPDVTVSEYASMSSSDAARNMSQSTWSKQSCSIESDWSDQHWIVLRAGASRFSFCL